MNPHGCNRVGCGNSVEANRDSRFLDRLTDGGNARGGIIGIQLGKMRGKQMIACIDAPSRKHDRTCGKRHRPCAFDKQMLGCPAIFTKQYQSSGGDCVIDHAPCLATRLHARKGRGSFGQMDLIGLIGTAASLSLLSGWRVYLCVLATGLSMHFGWMALPEHLQGLRILASPWIIGAAGFGVVAEVLADKIAWVDSLWDAVHTAIRPVGGALLALAVIDANDPTWQIVSLLLGGGAALVGHSAKAGARAVVNASPEPVSNIVVSTGEDVTATGLLIAAIANPVLALIIAIGVAYGSIMLIVKVRQLLAKLLPSPS